MENWGGDQCKDTERLPPPRAATHGRPNTDLCYVTFWGRGGAAKGAPFPTACLGGEGTSAPFIRSGGGGEEELLWRAARISRGAQRRLEGEELQCPGPARKERRLPWDKAGLRGPRKRIGTRPLLCLEGKALPFNFRRGGGRPSSPFLLDRLRRGPHSARRSSAASSGRSLSWAGAPQSNAPRPTGPTLGPGRSAAPQPSPAQPGAAQTTKGRPPAGPRSARY